MNIDISNSWYGDIDFTKNMFLKDNIELKQGVTVLIGCNGSGKSTLLHQIEDFCNKNDIPCIDFNYQSDNSSDNLLAKSIFTGNFNMAGNITSSSEGERISVSLGEFAKKAGRFSRDNQDKDKMVILMDSVDSGYSIDNIIELKHYLFKSILDDMIDNGKEIYIIISANMYELCSGENSFSVYHGEYVDINSYDDYKNLILETRVAKEERYYNGKEDDDEDANIFDPDFKCSIKEYMDNKLDEMGS
jgi:hypothetical protein